MPHKHIRIADLIPGRKPKTPGFGISKSYYLSVLAAVAPLPPVLSVMNPKGQGGAVAGFAVPLARDSKKEDLGLPMRNGAYAFASPDQKTVIRGLAMPKEEAGFEPAIFLASEAGRALPEDLAVRIRSTWSLIQLTFEAHDPAVFPALDLFLGLARRLASLTGGVVADPVCQIYRLPEAVMLPRSPGEPFNVQDLVHVKARVTGEKLHAYTLGLSKFAFPEIEIGDLEPDQADDAARLLLGCAFAALKGKPIEVGGRLGDAREPLIVAPGGSNRGLWEGIECLELIPEAGRTTSQALRRWAADTPNRGGASRL